MAARSKARKRALDLLYACELRGDDPVATLEQRIAEGEGPTNDYTALLVRGVAAHQGRIDELLRAYSEGWVLERMPAIDRTALRIGGYELLWEDDVPDPVAVSEAIALVRELSTDDSPGFVNGVLGALLRDKDLLDLDEPAAAEEAEEAEAPQEAMVPEPAAEDHVATPAPEAEGSQ